MSREEDVELARRALDRRPAFDELFDRYADRVHRLAAARARPGPQAQALTEQMLERVFSELDQYAGQQSLDAWVLARCRSVLASHVRESRRTRPVARLATPQGV